jgi:hypothetical protein
MMVELSEPSVPVSRQIRLNPDLDAGFERS